MKAARLFTITLVLFLLFIANSAGAAAQGNGVVEGKLTNGSSGGDKVGVVPVTLYVIKGNQIEEAGRGSTDGDGKFGFEGLDTSPDYIYWVSAKYRDVDYESEEFSLDGDGKKTVDLVVYEKTTDVSAIKLAAVNLAIMGAEETGILSILEVITFSNTSDKTYVSDGKSETVRLPLASQAYDFVLGHGLSIESVFPVEGGFATAQPIYPGEGQIIFAYKVNYSSTKYNLQKSFLYPVEGFSLFVPDVGIRAESSLLTSAGSMELEGRRYQVFTGEDIKPGSQLSITFSKLPRTGQPWISGLSTLQKGLAMGLMVVVAAAVIGYVYFSRRRRLVPVAEEGVLTEEVALPVEELEQERRSLLESIARLDEDFEAGNILEKEYHEQRSMAKQRLLDVIQQLRGGEEEP
ncbi:MAG: hypothetical protein HYX82_04370 [Chloroflexi bacterium]|nr:hypothetical protein [Chloroflexota bacterium]